MYTCDADGNILTITRGASVVTMTYATNGNMTSVTDPAGKEIHYYYNNEGQLLNTTDGNGNVIAMEYDESGTGCASCASGGGMSQPSKTVFPTFEKQYAYDSRDNLIALTDAQGNTTHFDYDAGSRLAKETRPMGEETTYDYDGAGNLKEKIDAKNQKTEYGYDDAGRLVTIMYYGSGATTAEKTVTFTYDATGNLTGYDDGLTSATYAYDALYQKTSETVNYGPFTRTNAYAYYPNGLKESFTGPDGVAVAYTYDAGNQFTGAQIPGVGAVSVGDYQWNRPAIMTLPGGVTKEF